MKKYYYYLLILTGMVLLMWQRIFFHSLQGESYIYFEDGFEEIIGMSYPGFQFIFRYDLFARLVYFISESVFRDNLEPLTVFVVVILIALVIAYFFMVKTLTRSVIVAFVSSLFFGLNHITNAGMIGSGYFQWSYQRIPGFIFSFISFIFYSKFFNKKSRVYYYISSGFFLLSILFAHYSIFFLPVFLLYSIVFSVVRKESLKSILRRFLELVPWILISYILITTKPSVPPPAGTTLYSTISDKDFLRNMLFQITMITVPLNILQFIPFSNTSFASAIDQISKLFPFVVLFYTLSIYFVFRKNKEWGAILIVALGALLSNAALNLYIHKVEVPAFDVYTNHYFFPLGFYVGLFWAIILYLISKINLVAKILAIVFICSWVYSNIFWYWRFDDTYKYTHTIHALSQKYVKNVAGHLQKGSLVILPRVVSAHAVLFYEKMYHIKDVKVISGIQLNETYVKSFDPKKDFLIDYDEKTATLVDETTNYKKIFTEKGFNLQ